MLKGTDISQWQGDVDFTKLKAATQFVIIKATEGYGFTDPKFKRNQAEARKVELPLGYYVFTRPDLGNTVEQEVDYLLAQIAGLRDGELIFLDFEVSYTKPVEWCKKWLDYLAKKLNGYKGLVYLNQSLLNNNDWTSLISAGYGLWLAIYDYKYDASMPVTKWGTCAFKQFSNKESISGVSGNVDCNAFYGDLAALKKYGVSIGAVTPTTNENVTQVNFEPRIKKLEEYVATSTSKDEDILYRVKSLENAVNSLKDYRTELKKLVDDLKDSYKKESEDLKSKISLLNDTVETLKSKVLTLETSKAAASYKIKDFFESFFKRG